MKNFLFGVLFASAIYPIICGLIGLFNQIIEYFCMVLAVKAAKKQAELTPEEAEGYNTQVIGFQVPNEEEEYYEDE